MFIFLTFPVIRMYSLFILEKHKEKDRDLNCKSYYSLWGDPDKWSDKTYVKWSVDIDIYG